MAEAIAADDGRDVRQVGAVDASGRAAAWTGAECTPWHGQHIGDGVVILGNMLAGPETLAAMVDVIRGQRRIAAR